MQSHRSQRDERTNQCATSKRMMRVGTRSCQEKTMTLEGAYLYQITRRTKSTVETERPRGTQGQKTRVDRRHRIYPITWLTPPPHIPFNNRGKTSNHRLKINKKVSHNQNENVSSIWDPRFNLSFSSTNLPNRISSVVKNQEKSRESNIKKRVINPYTLREGSKETKTDF